MAPLTAAELIEHPEFEQVLYNLPPAQKDKLAVAQGRGGPFNIVYEVHGHGRIHVVWLMGLGSFKTAWQRQMKDFGHDRESKYTCLIMDNRGMGESDKPVIRYSTSEMAKDVIEVVDHLGWTENRQLHVVGISMGGMIAQELALLIPRRIASLTLLSTAARIVNTQGFVENLRNRINLLIPKAIDKRLAMVKRNLFSEEFLAAPDAEGSFPSNGDRIAAQEVRKRLDPTGFTRTGFILQAIAANWHQKSAEQLRSLADQVGRDRIQVIHGDRDRMITPPHAHILVDELGGPDRIRRVIFKGRGHALPYEERTELTRLLDEWFDMTEALNRV